MHISELSMRMQEGGDLNRKFYNYIHLQFGSKPELEVNEDGYHYVLGCAGFNPKIVIPDNSIGAAFVTGRQWHSPWNPPGQTQTLQKSMWCSIVSCVLFIRFTIIFLIILLKL